MQNALSWLFFIVLVANGGGCILNLVLKVLKSRGSNFLSYAASFFAIPPSSLLVLSLSLSLSELSISHSFCLALFLHGYYSVFGLVCSLV